MSAMNHAVMNRTTELIKSQPSEHRCAMLDALREQRDRVILYFRLTESLPGITARGQPSPTEVPYHSVSPDTVISNLLYVISDP